MHVLGVLLDLPIGHNDEIVRQVLDDRKLKSVHEHRHVAAMLKKFRTSALVRHVINRRDVAVTPAHTDRHILVSDVCNRIDLLWG